MPNVTPGDHKLKSLFTPSRIDFLFQIYSILHVDHLVWWWCVLVHHIMLFNYTCVENGNVILPHFKNSRQSKDA